MGTIHAGLKLHSRMDWQFLFNMDSDVRVATEIHYNQAEMEMALLLYHHELLTLRFLISMINA